MFHEAVESYRMAKEFAETYLGPIDSITVNLQSIYNRAISEIDSQIEKA